MKYYEDVKPLHFRWEQIANAFWRRYPNPFSKHVLTEDVVSRDIRGNKLFTKRLIMKTNSATKLVERFVGSAKYTYVVEESIVDPVCKIITTYTRNIGALNKYATVEEKCTYRISPESTDVVLYERQAWFSSQYSGLSGKVICSFVHNRFKSNAKKAFNGFNHVLESLYGTPHALTVKEKIAEKAKKASDVAKKVKTYVPKS